MTAVLVSITALLASVAIMLVGHGLQLTLVPLYADQLNWDVERLGYIGSCYNLGFVVGCITLPRLISRVGHIRMFAVLTATVTASLLAIGIIEQFWFWLIARTITGWSLAGLYMVIESWLNEKSGPKQRGTILSIYTVITLVALCGGQLLIGVNIGYSGLFMLAALFLVMGIVPLGLTSSSAPRPIPAVKFRLVGILKASQVAVVGAFLGGFVTAGFWALGPIVARSNHLNTDQVGVFMAITILGGAVCQIPIGRLSDWLDRRYVIAGTSLFGAIVCALAVMLGVSSTILLYVTMFIFGGMTFPLYSLCLAHASDNTELPLLEIASGILMLNGAGSVFGPILLASLISYSSLSLFFVAATALLILALWTIYRIMYHPVEREHFKPFVGTPKTTHEFVELMREEEIQDTVI